MATTVPRRLFLQLTGWAGGIAYAAAQRKPPKATAKTLADRGRAADQLIRPLSGAITETIEETV